MLLRILLFAVLAFVLWRVGWRLLKGIFEGMGYHPPNWKPESVGLVRDPVCGMEINPQHAAATTAYQGQTFYFCRVECQEHFDRSPELYIKAA